MYKGRWIIEKGTLYVLDDGKNAPTVIKLGKTDSADACQIACAKNENCKAWSWYNLDPLNGTKGNSCTGMTFAPSRFPTVTATSGYLERYASRPAVASGTLMRTAGMESAGSMSTDGKESYRSPSIVRGTNWDGYMRPSVLL